MKNLETNIEVPPELISLLRIKTVTHVTRPLYIPTLLIVGSVLWR